MQIHCLGIWVLLIEMFLSCLFSFPTLSYAAHTHAPTPTHTHTHSSPCRKQQRTALCLQRPTCGCVYMCRAANIHSLGPSWGLHWAFMLSWILWVFNIETYTFGIFVCFFLKIALRLSSWRIQNLGSDLSSNKWVVISSLWVDNSGIGNCMYFEGKGKCDY